MSKKGAGLRFDVFEHDDEVLIVGGAPSIIFSESFDIGGQEPSSALLMVAGEYRNASGGAILRVFVDGQLVRPATGITGTDGMLAGTSGPNDGMIATTLATGPLAPGLHTVVIEVFINSGAVDMKVGKRSLAVLRL